MDDVLFSFAISSFLSSKNTPFLLYARRQKEMGVKPAILIMFIIWDDRTNYKGTLQNLPSLLLFQKNSPSSILYIPSIFIFLFSQKFIDFFPFWCYNKFIRQEGVFPFLWLSFDITKISWPVIPVVLYFLLHSRKGKSKRTSLFGFSLFFALHCLL